jgi:tyrosine-protein phosphatase SIW14
MTRILLVACILLSACTTAAETPRVRPAAWAQPVIGTGGPGNWFRVSSDLYRCEQPSRAEMRVLETFGIKAVVNLREFHSDVEETAGTTIKLTEVPLDTGELTYAQLVTVLKAMLAAPKPVVIHCWHGSDRTGTAIAAWRIAVDGWTPAEALDEMVAGGFGHHQMYGNLRTLVGSIDPAKLRADAGLPPR